MSFPINVPILGFSNYNDPFKDKEEAFYDPIELPHCQVEFSYSGLKRIIGEVRKKKFDDWRWFQLAVQADEMSLSSRDSKLTALDYLELRWKQLGVIPYPHQVKTAEKVVTEMRGQAILADEVGLGKTIEAGLILKEYMLRGLAKKVLILTPASLLWQWYQELYEKFHIIPGIQKREWDWENSDVLIASLDTAKRTPHAEIIKTIKYDMLIIDEAHKLKNNSTASFELVNAIQKKYCLMLTATPIQNDLKELYNLITLLRPGQLGSLQSFKSRFVKDKRTPKNPEELKALLSTVLIRNRRGEGTVQFTKRHVHPLVVELSKTEAVLYDQISQFIREESQKVKFQKNVLPLITLQREVCSSFYAAGMTLRKMFDNADGNVPESVLKLLDKVVAVEQNSKCDVLERLLKDIQDKVIVFTEYKASQEYIRYRLEKAGYSTVAFDGSLSRGQKQWAKYIFMRDKQVLVSTESGGEGLNLQFCNQIVNFDLPWNPMRLEQRIGRVHRLGQTRDVHIYNLVTKNTIEEHIMYLLHKKINMFQTILGELDAILIQLKLDKTFEGKLMDIFLHNDPENIHRELDALGDKIAAERQRIKSTADHIL